jgi:hypothetical protein
VIRTEADPSFFWMTYSLQSGTSPKRNQTGTQVGSPQTGCKSQSVNILPSNMLTNTFQHVFCLFVFWFCSFVTVIAKLIRKGVHFR